jgi:hypothetical protein
VLTSKSGKVPIASFCVEHGRWTRRGTEAADRFSGTDMAVAGNSLKVAVREKKDQAEVWNQVAQSQQKLVAASGTASGSYGDAVPHASGFRPPPTGSMQLAMEDKKIVEATDAYIRDLARIIDGKQDVVGYAFAVNGKLSSADIYASHDLCERMWPKLLNASAVEALEERPKVKASAPPDVAAVGRVLTTAEAGRVESKSVGARLSLVRKESEKALLFETRDRDLGGVWIHRSYIVK